MRMRQLRLDVHLPLLPLSHRLRVLCVQVQVPQIALLPPTRRQVVSELQMMRTTD